MSLNIEKCNVFTEDKISKFRSKNPSLFRVGINPLLLKVSPSYQELGTLRWVQQQVNAIIDIRESITRASFQSVKPFN